MDLNVYHVNNFKYKRRFLWCELERWLCDDKFGPENSVYLSQY